MLYVKATTTTPGFLVSLEVTESYQASCKEATGHQETILSALDVTSITSCKDVIQAFRDNKKYLMDYSDMPKVSTGNPYPYLEL